MTTQPPSHLHAEFQHHSSSHQFFNVQSVSIAGVWECKSEGERGGGGRKRSFFCLPRMKSQSRHQALFILHSHNQSFGWSLSSIWSLAAYRVLCNSQYSWSSVRYLTPQSPAGWVRGRGAFKAGSWCREFSAVCGRSVGFTRFEARTTALAKRCPLPKPEGGCGGGGGGGEGGRLKQRFKKYIFAGWVGRQTDTGENIVLKNKSKKQQQTLSDTHPNKTAKQKQKKNKMANKQVNQTIQSDIRPFQSDIKFLFLIPFNPPDLI